MTNINQPASVSTLPALRIPPFAFVLTVCIAAIGSNSLALGPIAPEVARSLAVSVPAVMTASAAFGLGTAASAFFLAALIDRHGARRMLMAALLLMVVGLAGSGLAPVLGVLVAAQFATGVAAGIAIPAIYTLAAAIAPAGRESQTIGVVLTGWTLSMVAGVSLSAVAADLVGWRAVYAAVAAATLAALAAVSLAPVREPAAGATQSAFAALRVRGAVPLLVVCAAFMAAFYGVYAYIGDHLHRALGLPLSVNGLVALSYGLGFGGAAFLDRFIDRFGAARLLPRILAAVAAVYAAMVAASGSWTGMVAVVFLWGTMNHFGLNVLIARLTALDPTRRGAMMGFYSGVTYLAMFAGTLGFGQLYGGSGFAALAATAAALMLAAAGFAAMTARRREGPAGREG